MKSIVVKREYLPSIANQDKFINAIQLGRIVGAIRCNNILQGEKIADDESNLTLRVYLLLNHAALLFEGIKTFHGAKSDYADLPYYKENDHRIGLLEIEFINPESFSNVVLKKIRNKIAFHFDKDVITSILRKLVEDSTKENKDVVLISGRSALVKDTAYILADNVNINFVLESIEGKDLEQEEKFKMLAKKLLDLSALFCNVIEGMIPDLIDEYCETKEEED